MLADFRFRLRALFKRRAMEHELNEELLAHIERETEKYVKQGIPRDEAQRRARLAFGGVDRIKDDTRDARGTALLEHILQDVRYAWRGLRSKPGFTAAVLIALGLGIGANTAMFAVVDRLLFRSPLFLRDSDRVHRVFEQYLWNGSSQTVGTHTYLRSTELMAVPSLEKTAVVSERRSDVGKREEAREMAVAAVSATLFDFFDVRPHIGRFFRPDEDKIPPAEAVAVLGYDFWRSSFGGRQDVLGQILDIGAVPYTIVGVAPEGFTGFSDEGTPAVYVPVTTFGASINSSFHRNHGWDWLTMFVRLRPGVSEAAATSDLTTAYQRSWNTEREASGGKSWPDAQGARARAFVAPMHLARGPYASADSKVATWVMGVAAIVLLIACANVGNLLLARAAGRRRETALRLALGVSLRRLLQQLLTESVLIATLGGAFGLAIATWGGRALAALFLPGTATVVVARDLRTLSFVAAVTLTVALLTGLAPVFGALRHDVAASLKAGVREGTYRRSRMRTALLLFQGALSVVLLVGAGLFVRSLKNVRDLRLGYDVDPIVVVDGRIRARLNPAERNALGARLLGAVQATPGVRSASLATSIPFGGNEGRGLPYFPGADTARVRRGARYMLQAGTPQYFETVGTRILRGRGITEADRANAQLVVVVNQAMAEWLWPGEDALGKQMRVGEQNKPYLTIVGIAENMRGSRIEQADEHWWYLPWDQYQAVYGGEVGNLLIRVTGRAEDYAETLRRRVQQEVPGNSFVRATPLRALVAPRQRAWEFAATMFVAFGALALGLAGLGLYSVIAYAVAQRSHEMGVRMALGASLRNVVGMVMRQGVTFALAGIAIGSVIALWAGQFVEPLLFDQKARDPIVFAVVSAVLLVAALAATLGPAWRAMRVDPTVALRSE